MTQPGETKLIEYQGFIGEAIYIADEGLYDGRIINLERSFISFRGATEDELRRDLADSIEFYNAFCRKYKVAPEMPFRMKDVSEILSKREKLSA